VRQHPEHSIAFTKDQIFFTNLLLLFCILSKRKRKKEKTSLY